MSENSDKNLPAVIRIANIGAGFTVNPKFTNPKSFSMTHRFNVKEYKSRDLDLLEILASMSKKEAELFIKIKQNMSYKTNVATLDFSELTLSQKNHTSNYISALTKHNVVKRCKGEIKGLNGEIISYPPNSFIVNPAYIIPPDKFIDNVFHVWNSFS